MRMEKMCSPLLKDQSQIIKQPNLLFCRENVDDEIICEKNCA